MDLTKEVVNKLLIELKGDTLIIPEGYTVICNGAFSSCDKIKKIILPSTIKDIKGQFGACPSLECIEVSENNSVFFSRDGVLYRKLSLEQSKNILTYFDDDESMDIEEKIELVKYPAKKSDSEFVVEENVFSIYETAFEGCNNLIKVILPSTLRNIIIQEMNNCKNLEEIVVNGDNPIYRSIDGVLYFWPDATAIYGEEYQKQFESDLFNFKKEIEKFHMGKINFSSYEKMLWGKGLISYPYNRKNKIYEIPEGVREIRHIHTPNIDEIILSSTVTAVQHINGDLINKIKSEKSPFYSEINTRIGKFLIMDHVYLKSSKQVIYPILPCDVEKYIDDMEQAEINNKEKERIDKELLNAMIFDGEKIVPTEEFPILEQRRKEILETEMFAIKRVLQVPTVWLTSFPGKVLNMLKQQGVTHVQLIDGENDFGTCVEFFYEIDDFIKIAELMNEIRKLLYVPGDIKNKDKILYAQIYMFLVCNINYNLNASNPDNHKLTGLLNGLSVCEGYNQILHHFVKALFPHIVASGYTEKIGHAWDLSQLDGEWFESDITNDSAQTHLFANGNYPITNISDRDNYVFLWHFLKNKTELEELHGDYIPQPKCKLEDAESVLSIDDLMNILETIYHNGLVKGKKYIIHIDNLFELIDKGILETKYDNSECVFFEFKNISYELVDIKIIIKKYINQLKNIGLEHTKESIESYLNIIKDMILSPYQFNKYVINLLQNNGFEIKYESYEEGNNKLCIKIDDEWYLIEYGDVISLTKGVVLS